MTERLTRRTLLRLGAGLAGACALDPLWQLGIATASGSPADVSSPSSGKATATLTSGSFMSAARGGVETKWAIARPPGQYGPLRPVIALHGRDMDADGVMGMGVETGLAELAKAGYPPFAVVAVDGGNGWWHRRVNGDDSGAMVLNELLPMLPSQGLDTSRVSFIGWSMGGYGSLLLGGALGPKRVAAICAVAPALFTDYGLALQEGAFDGPADWFAYSVYGTPALSEIPLRIDCGAEDRFFDATKQFVSSLRRPPAGVSFEGGHDVEAWKVKLPRELAWLAS
jgi:pimeloyl-ACP methyl ester carboxylesterase